MHSTDCFLEADRFLQFDGYRPLKDDEIRLFRLLPGKRSDPVQGHLEHARMTNGSCSVRYEALSYCWGTPVFNGEVVIDGQVSHVTESLDTALRHLRSETQTMTLWIDAICINQMDLAERSQQVQGMLDTYQSAHCVYTWLGPSTERTAAGMMALESIWKGREGDGEPAWASMPPDVIGPGLEDILTRPYFERMWVVQETAIAR